MFLEKLEGKIWLEFLEEYYLAVLYGQKFVDNTFTTSHARFSPHFANHTFRKVLWNLSTRVYVKSDVTEHCIELNRTL